MVIEFNFIPESLNELIKMHRMTRATYTANTKAAVALLCKKYPPITKYPVDLVCTITKTNKHKGDSDNYNLKAFIDGIVAAGVLKDDNTDYVRKISYQLCYGDKEKTVIEFI